MADIEIKPLRGIWRTPNELAAPPGSCQALEGCCIRQAGIIEPLPALTAVGATNSGHLRMWDIPDDASNDKILAIAEVSSTTNLVWIDKSDGTITAIKLPDGSTAASWEEGIASMARYRNRTFVTTKEGLMVIDAIGDTTMRRAGMLAPAKWGSQSESSTDAQAVEDTKFVAYKAVYERVLGDGSRVQSAPSTPILYENDTGSTQDVTNILGWYGASGEVFEEVAAGDFVALYRTDGFDTEAGVDGVYRLVKRQEVTSTDVTNEYITIVDNVPDASLGEELYTNPGQQGATKAFYCAPYLRDVVVFGDALVGVAYEERQSMTLRVPGKWGQLSTDAERATGIGSRTVTGDTSTGTNTILNVSASHMKGIVAGQDVSHADFPAGTRVTAAAGSTITVDNNSTGTSVGTSVSIRDVIEIAGTEYNVHWPSNLTDITNQPAEFEVQLSIPVQQAQAQGVGVDASISKARATAGSSTFGVRATNGANWSPDLPEINETARPSTSSIQGNRIAWSEVGQPEHWPLINRDTFGEGEIIRLIQAGDAIYAFNTDARIYRISGSPGSFRYDVVAENVLLVSTGSVTVHAGIIYAWTDGGVVAIRDGFVQNLSNPRLSGDMKDEYDNLADNEGLPWSWYGVMTFDRFNREVWLDTDTGSTYKPWIYNTDTDEFFQMEKTTYQLPLYVESLRTVFIWEFPGGESPWDLKRFVARTTATKTDTTVIEINRLDGGAAGLLKTWREIVLLFAPSAGVTQTITLVTTADKQVGSGTDSTAYTATLDSAEPTHMNCYISRASSMSAQMRIKLTTSSAAGAWALEGIVVRVEPLVDRTGARDA